MGLVSLQPKRSPTLVICVAHTPWTSVGYTQHQALQQPPPSQTMKPSGRLPGQSLSPTSPQATLPSLHLSSPARPPNPLILRMGMQSQPLPRSLRTPWSTSCQARPRNRLEGPRHSTHTATSVPVMSTRCWWAGGASTSSPPTPCATTARRCPTPRPCPMGLRYRGPPIHPPRRQLLCPLRGATSPEHRPAEWSTCCQVC
mmetsp:Transcript_42545/g.76389  ORF Transcript_42545/g.76389 Transcript_42545/m.76389 type:complete len:200 (+) Transcript_42545:849-1448(+)